MRSVSRVSRSRAGIARLVIATRSRSHTEESRVNSRFGSGSIRKSSRLSRLDTSAGAALRPGWGGRAGRGAAAGCRRVGARGEQRVAAAEQAGHQRVLDLELVVADAGGQGGGQLLRALR